MSGGRADTPEEIALERDLFWRGCAIVEILAGQDESCVNGETMVLACSLMYADKE